MSAKRGKVYTLQQEEDEYDQSEVSGEEQEDQEEDQQLQEEEGEEQEEEEDIGDSNDADIRLHVEGDEGNESAKANTSDKARMTLPADQALLNIKINDIIEVLQNFKSKRDPARSRQSYVEELQDCLCKSYGYNHDLIELFSHMFSPNELIQFLDANEQPRVTTIRTNTLKTRRRELAQILIQRGVNLDPVADWSKVGLKIYESKIPIGATPEYLAGFYMLQSASSFLPVLALAPQVNERILDMAAAPGGKTTYIAQLMKNTGVLFANDSKRERLEALKFNLQRMGVTNSIVCNYDGRKFPKIMKNFDRVLLDAPCTGLGIISRDPSIKATKTLYEIYKAAHLQKELLLAAIDCTKQGGHIVYSTCSVTVQENEEVIEYALKKRHVKMVEMGLTVGEDGYTKFQEKRFNADMRRAKRVYPHTHNMDGFFIAKLLKTGKGKKGSPVEEQAETEVAQEDNQQSFVLKERTIKAQEKINKIKSKKAFKRGLKGLTKSVHKEIQVSQRQEGEVNGKKRKAQKEPETLIADVQGKKKKVKVSAQQE